MCPPHIRTRARSYFDSGWSYQNLDKLLISLEETVPPWTQVAPGINGDLSDSIARNHVTSVVLFEVS